MTTEFDMHNLFTSCGIISSVEVIICVNHTQKSIESQEKPVERAIKYEISIFISTFFDLKIFKLKFLLKHVTIDQTLSHEHIIDSVYD